MPIVHCAGAVARAHRHVAYLACAFVLLIPRPGRAETIERSFLSQARDIRECLLEKKYRNVGVLKFLSRGPDGKVMDRPGVLYFDLARRLTTALILVDDRIDPINIFTDPDKEAARIRGASHLTPAGRQKLFCHRYDIPWKGGPCRPDVFLTGIVETTPNLKQVRVTLQVVHPDGMEPLKIHGKPLNITVRTDADALTGLGRSFRRRGADEEKLEFAPVRRVGGQGEPADQANATAPTHVIDIERLYAEMPVRLEIRYYRRGSNDYEEAPIDFVNGEARVKEPNPGQKVVFILAERNPSDKARYGIVLKVNGVNTLDKERRPALQCSKWVLEPGRTEGSVPGFQVGGNFAEEFTVKAQPEPGKDEVYYDDGQIGQFSFEIFGEKTGADSDSEKPDRKLVATEFAPLRFQNESDKPDNVSAVQRGLLKAARRGIIVGGARIESKPERVDFDTDPNQHSALTITYYHPHP